jgi:hypothetical protein
MKINDDSIKELLLPFQEQGEKPAYYCYGVITATIGQAMLLGSLASVVNTYFILGFTDRKLILLRINMLGKLAEKSVISYEKIKTVKVSTWMFGMGKKINIRLVDNSILKLKINKIGVGIHKQKENLMSVCELMNNRFTI